MQKLICLDSISFDLLGNFRLDRFDNYNFIKIDKRETKEPLCLTKINKLKGNEYFFSLGKKLIEIYERIKNLSNQPLSDQSSIIIDALRNFIVFNRIEILDCNIIVLEGERCSGKDTTIEYLKNQGNLHNVFFAPRKTNNTAWQFLNNYKKDCYFYLGDIVQSILLWFADISYRISDYLIASGSKPTIFINRYVYSVLICICSNYFETLRHEYKEIIITLISKIFNLFPIANLVFSLNTSNEILKKRLKNTRKHFLTYEESQKMANNIKLFKLLTGKNIFHIKINNKSTYEIANFILEKLSSTILLHSHGACIS